MDGLTPWMQAYILVLAAILGACVASFANCMGWRIVHGESVLRGRSHCDVCGHALGPADLVPVVSYLAAKGRCRYCKAKLSARHVWGELIAMAVFVGIVMKFGLTLETVEYLLFAAILLAASFADLEGYIIPDRFIVAGIAVRLVFILVSGNIGKELLFSALGGFAVAGGLLLIVLIYEKLTHKEAMGGGDIKLLFVTGLVLGWKRNLLCLFFACIVGIVFGMLTRRGRTGKAFPFGPSIAIAAFFALLFGDGLIASYLAMF